MEIKTAAELAAACKDVAVNHKTLYVMGCFGAPMTASNKDRYTRNHSYNRQTVRTTMIKAASADTFGFDCVNLIKGLLWGWNGDTGKTYGGATYNANGVPDISADQMIKVCRNVTTDFSTIKVGEAVWMEGHIGVYIGNGLAVESTPKWDNCVQITAVHNIGTKAGHNGRKWTKHGELPYVTYEAAATEKPAEKPTAGATATTKEEIAVKVSVLKKGAKGSQVKALQILLMGYGGEPEKLVKNAGGADGNFGAGTEKALNAYKKANGLPADGLCGAETLAVLLGYV